MKDELIAEIVETENGLRLVQGKDIFEDFSLLTSSATISLNAESLNVSETILHRGWSSNFDKVASVLRGVHGVAQFEDKGIAVIGDPSTKANRIDFSIVSRTQEAHLEALGARLREMQETGDDGVLAIPEVNLGFTSFGPKRGKWWLEINMSEQAVEDLATAVLGKQIHSLRIGIGLKKLYTNAPYGAVLHNDPKDLFLRPGTATNDARQPEVAVGWIRGWHLQFTGVLKLSDPNAPVDKSTPQAVLPEVVAGPTMEEKMLAAIEQLTVGVSGLRAVVVKGFWVLALVVAIVAVLK